MVLFTVPLYNRVLCHFLSKYSLCPQNDYNGVGVAMVTTRLPQFVRVAKHTHKQHTHTKHTHKTHTHTHRVAKIPHLPERMDTCTCNPNSQISSNPIRLRLCN